MVLERSASDKSKKTHKIRKAMSRFPWSHAQRQKAETIEWVLWVSSKGLGTIQDKAGQRALQRLNRQALASSALQATDRNISMMQVCETLFVEECYGKEQPILFSAIQAMAQYLLSLPAEPKEGRS